MKISVVVLVLCMVLAGGCGDNHKQGSLVNDTSKATVRSLSDFTLINEVEYEGHKYLSVYHGGIIHSESCPCKKEK